MSENAEMGRIGTVAAKNEEGLQIQFDGDEETGEKYYKCNTSIRFDVGDRVLTLPISGTYIVFCKIGAPGGPVTKTDAMVNAVGADGNGKLYTTPAEEKVKPVAKTDAMTQDVGMDSTTGKLYTKPGTEKVKPVAKTNAMTQDVGMDSTTGKLYTIPQTVKPVTKTAAMTEDVGVDSNGKLYAAPAAVDWVKTLKQNANTSVKLEMNASNDLVPSYDTSTYGIGIGTNSYFIRRAYIGSDTAKIGSSDRSKLGFYGTTPVVRQTLSTTTQNQGYTSATASNYLTIINNIVGILKKLGLLI